MRASSDDAGRGGFGETFAKAHALCLRAIPLAQRLEDLEDIRKKATSLAWCARRAGNFEAERQSDELRVLAEWRIRQLTRPAMLAPELVRGRNGGLTRATRLTPERRREIARVAAAARWERAS